MSTMASQITSLAIVYSIVYSGADQREHQSSASLAVVRGIHRSPVNFLHKGPVTRKIFHLMMSSCIFRTLLEDGGSGSGLDLEDHLLFCQMDFLCHFEGGEVGWKEAARSGQGQCLGHMMTSGYGSVFSIIGHLWWNAQVSAIFPLVPVIVITMRS